MSNSTQNTLRLILGDQLNHSHSWFDEVNAEVIYVMMEMRQETDYAQHHIQKIVAFFAAMRAFAHHLRSLGHEVIYLTLDDPHNQQDLAKNLDHLIHTHSISHFSYQLPDEYRLDQQLKSFCQSLHISHSHVDTEHFLTKREELQQFFDGKKQYLLESFYRSIRRKYGILMDGDQPISGRWNYDAENRKKLPKRQAIPVPLLFNKSVEDLYQMIHDSGVKYIGTIDESKFIWPSTRAESLQLLTFFLDECLPYFGTYQDAMTDRGWSLFHSRLSFAMNVKLLSPLEVVEAAISHWEAHSEEITLAQIEGFVRQIIGWREYMRGVYWAHMPDYASLNYFDHQRKLPGYFWTGKTKMNCISQAVNQSLEYAYAHHIQRLMVTGNFVLLAGIDPDEVDAWYLGIYIDAIEWVEITNTRGMSQFADGGIVGTKPYVSSANYIHKMGDYCGKCHYNKKEKVGEGACPFNSLYWHFYHRNRHLLTNNPRIGMMYRVWDKMEGSTQRAILDQAEQHLAQIEHL